MSVAAAWATGGAAATYPNEAQFRRAIAEVAPVAAAESLVLEALDAQKENLKRPFMASGLSLINGNCMVFYNTQPFADLKEFFDTMPEADLPLWLRVMAVHEITHCVEQREAFVHRRFARALPPGHIVKGMTVKGYLSDVKTREVGLWQEALADISAVLYLQQAEPTRWKRYAEELAALRAELAPRHPAHVTTGWIEQMLEREPVVRKGESVFERAFVLRMELNPR